MFTQGKWEVGECKDGIYAGKMCLVKSEVAEILGPRQVSRPQHPNVEANAQRIVQCCNGWDELTKQRDDLLKALQKISEHEDHRLKVSIGYDEYVDIEAKQAIKAAQ